MTSGQDLRCHLSEDLLGTMIPVFPVFNQLRIKANKPAKQYDTSWMNEYQDEGEEEKKEEQPVEEANEGQAAAAQ